MKGYLKRIKAHYLIVLSLIPFFIALYRPPIMIDKEAIIDPLQEVKSPIDYFSKLSKGEFYDFQIVRDFSHLADLFTQSLIGNWDHVGTIQNLIIFLLTLLTLFKILSHFFDIKIVRVLLFCFAFHPLVFLIYVEITQRKHILSFLFFLISYLAYLERKNSKSYFYFLLSGLSQPINLLTPLWFLVQEKNFNLKAIIKKFLPYFLITAFIVFFNFYIYKKFHYEKIGFSQADIEFNFSFIITAIGLHFRLFFLPISYANFYSIFTLTATIFSLSLPIYIFIVWKLTRKTAYISLVLPILIFFTLYGHKSNVLSLLIQNTYVLTPAFGFLLFLGFLARNRKNFHKYIGLFSIILWSVSVYTSIIRKDPIYFYESTVEREPNCRVLQRLTEHYIINDKNIQKMQRYGHEWLRRKCYIFGNKINQRRVLINTHLILESRDFSHEDKLFLFSQKFNFEHDKTILKIALELRKKERDLIYLDNLLSNFKDYENPSLFIFRSYIGDEIEKLCKTKTIINCSVYTNYVERVKERDIIIGYKKNIPLNEQGERILVVPSNQAEQ